MREPWRGMLCGAAATAILPVSDWAMRRVLGREPVFAPQRLAAAAARHLTGSRPSGSAQTLLGWGMRALYTPALGLGLGFLMRRLWPLESALALTAAIVVGERASLPGLKLTPPWRKWSPRERLLLPLHALSFALTAAALDAIAANLRGASFEG